MFELAVMLIIVITSIWVLIDASQIGARKGLLGGSADYGPGGWFVLCLLLWIVAFPWYLSIRPRIIAAGKGNPFAVARAKTCVVDQVEAWDRCQQKRVAIATVPCPHCAIPIVTSGLRMGENTCQRCGGSFSADV